MKNNCKRKIQSAVKLIRSTGVSAEEVAEIDCRDVFERNGVFVWVGFGELKRQVMALDDTPLRLAKEAKHNGRKRLVTQVPFEDEVRRAQGHFAREMYKRYAVKDISQLPKQQVYVGWNDELFDENALYEVGKQMGGYCVDWVAYLMSCT